ncbi:MAG: radical SAM protein [Oscillospiraceae bacterium]|nr:radical SAM protein [Oscillospiraceae bacterium]
MEYNHIALLLTEDCNARCKMCCDSRGTVKGHTLTIDELNTILRNIKDYTSIETIGITGGEPMLYPELVEYIFNYDYGRKLDFTIKTNGFWGDNIYSSSKFLNKYKDIIINISFSYDEFHKEFINLDNIKNIIDLCITYKINTDIVGCFLNDGMKPGDVLDELGNHAYLTKFLYQPVVNTGSAKKFDDSSFIKLLDTNKHEIKCLFTVLKTIH